MIEKQNFPEIFYLTVITLLIGKIGISENQISAESQIKSFKTLMLSSL
jgi:hypothetical protein